MDIVEKVRKAKLQLIINNNLRIFGCILYKFNFELNPPEKCKYPAAVTIKNNKPTIIFNTDFLEKCSIRQIIFVILHEMLHVINGHLKIAFGLNINLISHRRANIAQDHCINKPLVEDSKNAYKDILEIPNVPYVLFQEIIHKNYTWEEVYNWLLDNKFNNDDGSDSYDSDDNTITIDGEDYSLDIIPSDELGPDEANDENAADIITQDLKAVIRSVIDNNIGNIRGNSNSKIFEFLNKITEIKLPWTSILEKVIAIHMIPSMENRSWKSYNKFLRQYAILPSFDNEITYNTMYAVIDASTSVDSEDLKKFAGVIENSLMLFKQIRIMYHSVSIASNILYQTEDIIQNKNILLEVYGRGGTSHTDCFNFIEKHYEEDKVEFIIFLTDYDSNIENIWNSYTWHEEVPCKFVLNKDNPVADYVDDSPILIDKYISK